MKDRLQLVHNDKLFANRTEAINYIKEAAVLSHPALYAEPVIVKYGSADEPNIILGIGSVGDGTTQGFTNKYFIIDTANLEESIKELQDEFSGNTESIKILTETLKNVISSCGLNDDGTYTSIAGDLILENVKSLKEADVKLSEAIQNLMKSTQFSTKDSETITFDITKDSESGVTLTGNVNVPDTITDGLINIKNIISVKDTGIFANVDLSYDYNSGALTFTNGVNTSVFNLPLETYVKSGSYDPSTENLVLVLNRPVDTINESGATIQTDKIYISLANLVDEWDVKNELSSPVTLTKTRVISGKDELSANLKIYESDTNILVNHENTGYLEVKGTADNIQYAAGVTVKDKIDDIISQHTVSVEDSNTVDMSVVSTVSGGTKIKADVNISTNTGNIIVSNDTGIFALVDLTYEPASGKLSFTNGIDSKEFSLTLNSFLKKGYYDSSTGEIVLLFATSSGGNDEIRIQVSELIDEWDVKNDVDSPIVLTKVVGTNGNPDILSATLKFSTVRDNIAENLNGTVYVKGTADNIKFNSETVDSALNSILGDSATTGSIKQQIKAEADRAIAAETKIANDLAAEVTRAKEAESGITSALTAETTRATAAEKANADAIVAEKERATIAENKLTSDLAAEVTRAKEAESGITSALTAETTRATAAETQLSNDLATEVTRATTEETRLTTHLNDEISRAKNAEINLSNALSTEVTRAQAAEAANTNKIADNTKAILDEVVRSKEAEASIVSALTQEQNRAITAETKIANDLVTEVTRAQTAEAKVLSDANAYTDTKVGKLAFTPLTNNTMSLSIDKSSTDMEYNIKGQINISSASGNAIVETDGGIYSTIDLEYSVETGNLTLTAPNVSRTIPIAINGLIQDVQLHDNQLVFTFKLADGTTKVQAIDLTGLISDWEIDNTKVINGKTVSIDLFKEKATPSSDLFQVYGDVKIVTGSAEPTVKNNILDKLTDGRLYVDGVSSNIMHGNSTLDSVITNIENNITITSGSTILSGTYDKNTATITLEKSDGTTISITGVTGGSGGGGSVTSATVSADGKFLTIKQDGGSDVIADLTNTISAATSQVSYNPDNTGHTVVVAVNNASHTISADLASTGVTIDCGTY